MNNVHNSCKYYVEINNTNTLPKKITFRRGLKVHYKITFLKKSKKKGCQV